MIVRELKPGIFALVAIDWDRKLFDELVPLPEGTSPVHLRFSRCPPCDFRSLRRNHDALPAAREEAWAGDATRPAVVLPYLSMYESTAKMVAYLIDRLMENGIAVQPFNVVELDSGRFAAALVEASTVVFASPTVLDGPHPAMATAAYIVNALKPKTRYGGIIGSYGWGNDAMQNSLAKMLPNLAVTWFEPVVAGGVPKTEGFAALDRLANSIALANAT